MDKNNVIPVFLNDDILSGQGYILLSNNSWANAIPGLVGTGSVSGRGYQLASEFDGFNLIFARETFF